MNGIVTSLIVAALTLPPLAPPSRQPTSQAKIELGRDVFFARITSTTGQIGCADCHNPEHGWSDGRRVAQGVRGQLGNLHSPTIINACFSPRLFWNSRVIANQNANAEQVQSLQPIVNPIEHGQQTLNQMLTRLNNSAYWRARFAAVYGQQGFAGNNTRVAQNAFADAIANFEQTIVVSDTPLQRRMRGDAAALTPDQEIGFGLMQRANCFVCHAGDTLTSYVHGNNGLEFVARRYNGMVIEGRKVRVSDDGRASAPGVPDNTQTIRSFKIPPLVEVEMRGPFYTHSGMFTLDEMIEHYSTGGLFGLRDPLINGFIQPQNWTAEQKQYVKVVLTSGTHSPNYPFVTVSEAMRNQR